MRIHKEIMLSGSGGQGLILAGIILAEAAISDGLNCVQTQSYGPEARGGSSKAEVIISDNIINYPNIMQCDILLSLTEDACKKYICSLKPGGTLILDSKINLPERRDIDIWHVPILDTALLDLKNPVVSNIVALGTLSGIINIVSEYSIITSILNRVPYELRDLNKKAFYKGLKLQEQGEKYLYERK
ncbi:2-oxoacid:acceptor oxidoreductase family protein [Clostridiisalibacter paucivorans]|uniref:2-oxoacid:acceptor oxidoreductase family protein n=1 Tax=Clostridiisalibacter paucivorans TaxID=408753 RepID=UPI00047E7445|nr:2-oxoacid:acceptor oxidoreductase family protein [Clostridiisalibacter paucivorans]